jgi:sugar transferase (PEP-CTERM/EpsH1 system associated)
MRVLFLTHRLPYAPNRGDRIRAHHMVRVLARDHAVHVVSLVHSEDEFGRAGEVRALGVEVHCARVPRFRKYVRALVALATGKPLTHALLHSPELPRILRAAVHSGKPDVILAYCSSMAQYPLEEPLRGIPFVLDMVDVDSEKWSELARRVRWPRKWVYRREHVALRAFERRAARAACATTVITDREQALISALGPDMRASVIPNGVDVETFAPGGDPQESSEVVFCGVFDYEPNVQGALWLANDVWPLVRRCNRDARLTLVGMNPTRAVSALGSRESIAVTGAVADVRPYLWRAALAVAPLHVARGLQNKVLEALAAQLPCVVTEPVFAALPERAKPGCTPSSDASSFARAILDLLAETPAARRARARRSDLSLLTWEQQLASFSDLLGSARAGALGPDDRLPPSMATEGAC